VAYWSPQALGRLAQSESSGDASLIHYPQNAAWGGSGGGSSATGLYGYTTGTWQTYAQQAGVDINQYPYAYLAPASVQTQVALQTPISNWTCPGCNSVASNLATNPDNVMTSPASGGGGFPTIINNPTGAAFQPGSIPGVGGLPQGPIQWSDQTFSDPAAATLGAPQQFTGGYDGFDAAGNPVIAGNSPVSSGGGASITLPDVNVSANTYGGLDPNALANPSGDPTAPAIIPGASGNPITQAQTAASNALTQIGQFTGNWIVRGGVIVVGIVLIAAAAWSLSKQSGVTLESARIA
jgi:hypothetical protein